MKDTKKTMQNRIITSKGTFLFVEVPDDVTNFIVEEFNINRTTLSFVSEKEDLQYIINLYGICSKIATTRDITEEQAESIVDEPHLEPPFRPFGSVLTYPASRIWNKYKYCNHFKKVMGVWYTTICGAKESLNSLLEAYKLDLNKNYLILKLL